MCKFSGQENRQLSEDERSIGYITGSLAYLPDNMGYLSGGNQDRRLDFPYDEPSSHYPLWKPPGNYFPRGEAPPPYEEAVAAARAEAALAAAMASNAVTSHATAVVVGHRTIPINLATSGSFRIEPTTMPLRRDSSRQRSNCEGPRRSLRMADVPAPLLTPAVHGSSAAIRSDAYYEDVLVGPPSCLDDVESFNPCHATNSAINLADILPPDVPVLTLFSIEPPAFTVTAVRGDDSPTETSPLNDLNKCTGGTCSCSYPCLPTATCQPWDDNDDYRSECENCKSMHGSSYYVDEESNATSPQETMTLQRRPQDYDVEEQAYYPTSLTLPTHTRRPR